MTTVTVAGRELALSPRVAYRAARAEVARTPRALKAWYGLLLVLISLPRTRTVAGTGIASALAFVGVLMDRLLFVSAGQIIPTTAVGGVVSQNYVDYMPSLVEISIVAAAFAFVAFVYTLAERYLDLREGDAHEPFHLPAFISRPLTRLADRRAKPEPLEPADEPAVGEA